MSVMTIPVTEQAFCVQANTLVFGAGNLSELGAHARTLALHRVLLVVDSRVAEQEIAAIAQRALAAEGIDAIVFDAVRVEPTAQSVTEAGKAAREAQVDGFISLGGGSTMDTAKIANLLSSFPASLDHYLPRPFGQGGAVPGRLKPHIACPTTFGTAAETTGIATLELPRHHAKAAIVAPALRPTLGLLDSHTLHSLPPLAVAANGFDLLSHAIESHTARPFHTRPASFDPANRPLTQGANPLASLGCLEAIRLLARHLIPALSDPTARAPLMQAGLLAGVVFGNSGNHLPHALSYPISGAVLDWRAPGYPDHPLVPHGIAVALGAPAAFRHLAAAAPQAFAQVAAALGIDLVAADRAGDAVAQYLRHLARAAGLPNGLAALGFGPDDIPALAAGALAQTRLIDNAPVAVTQADLEAIARDSLYLWSAHA